MECHHARRVRKHEFENLIALCPTCHRRKGNGPDQIDRKALRQQPAPSSSSDGPPRSRSNRAPKRRSRAGRHDEARRQKAAGPGPAPSRPCPRHSPSECGSTAGREAAVTRCPVRWSTTRASPSGPAIHRQPPAKLFSSASSHVRLTASRPVGLRGRT
ncbi:HNH endonuclease [Streptomyces sp. NPDC058052]|uniref:HNH endonuclease n=1 Tax=Streptomyces sp. NPDC058052 TaxID=3346316 RepID=UPI0036E8EB79